MVSKGDVNIRDCEAFWDVIFYQNAQTFCFFDIAGKMRASLKCQSFRIQLKLLPSPESVPLKEFKMEGQLPDVEYFHVFR